MGTRGGPVACRATFAECQTKLSWLYVAPELDPLLGIYADHAERQIFFHFRKRSFIKLAKANKTQRRQNDSNFLLQINSFQV